MMAGGLPGWWRYGVAIVATTLVIWYVGPSALVETLRHTDLVWLALYFAAFMAVPLLLGLQLLVTFRLAGFELPSSAVVASALQAWGVGTLTPARTGDLSLAYFLRQHVPEATSIAAVSIDKLFSLVTLAILTLAGTAGLALPISDALLAGAAVAAGGGMAILLVFGVTSIRTPLNAVAGRWFGGRAAAAWNAARGLAASPRVLSWCMAMATLRWLYICSINMFIFKAVGQTPGFWHILAATGVGRIISLAPVSVGGVGLKEPAQIIIYGSAGIPAGAVLSVSALGLACSFAAAAIAQFLAGLVLQTSDRKS